MVYVFFFLTDLLSMIISRIIHAAAHVINAFLFMAVYYSIVCVCVCVCVYEHYVNLLYLLIY